ncbi:hypothetical protein HPP92_011633 [Vanilla planifolia]|uniref:U-box domain-containing protein n=1 Tax=Vanilla planifolia TaxID=51239 RepID=A0A835V175_VANPL|nr:hypothetical protein HPP92_011633 [Vanilla planifolia]
MLIAEKLDLMAGLVRLIGECDKEAVEVGLQCLMELIGCDPSASSSTSLSARKVRTDMARAGIVPTLTLVLERDAEELLMPAGERAMRAMEAMAECAEGRAAICAESKRCVEAVLGKMMKVRNEGKLAAVALLWSLCCAGCGDRRAREAVAGSKGAMAKILMVMQGIAHLW